MSATNQLNSKEVDFGLNSKEVVLGLNSEEITFGLDIGTRTIIGLVGYKKEDEFHILASKLIEHESRAMIDGQIHDIGKVAKTASQVKKELENITGFTFKKVAIAAAGRSLKTYNVSVFQQLDTKGDVLIDASTIKSLEIEGLNKAQTELVKELDDDEKYFCVGYSVVNYYLNGLLISNLEGHKGKKIAADVLATFLPQIVVDSLYAVVERIGLEVASMTLEPIAAINVVIPENLRLLNLALVDIGAGTSDIAVTKDGSISAYGMIPMAGDEITEQLVHNYLVDFKTAEFVKQQIANCEEITFQDILGMEHTATKQELLDVIEPIVEKLASEVAAKIYLVNGGKSASAVFCVGGSSQICGFIEKLCAKLEIAKERVAIRGSESLAKIIFPEEQKLIGPMYVTPIGICITSALDKGYEFIYISVNGDIVELMSSKELTVLDAAIAKGFNHTNLINRKGGNLLFRLNGSIKKISGNFGTPAELYINDEIASLDSSIKEDDKIIIIPAVNGENAKAFVKDFINQYEVKNIHFNGTTMDLSAFAMINGNMASIDEEIQNDDEVYICKIDSIKDFCEYSEIDLLNKEIYLNNEIVLVDTIFKDGDYIEIKTIKNVIAPKQEIIYNKPIIKQEDNPISLQVIVNGKVVTATDNKNKYIFVDIFNYFEFDLSKPKGIISLKLNGKKANYTDLIKTGDYIDIGWEKLSQS